MATYFLTCFTLLSCFSFTFIFSEKSPPTATCQVYLNCTVSMNIAEQTCIDLKNSIQRKQNIQTTNTTMKVGHLCQLLHENSSLTLTLCNSSTTKFFNVCILWAANQISDDSYKSNTAKKTGFKSTESKHNVSFDKKIDIPKTDNQIVTQNTITIAKNDSSSSSRNMTTRKPDVSKTNNQNNTNATNNDKSSHSNQDDKIHVSTTDKTISTKNDSSSSSMTTSKPDGLSKTNNQNNTNSTNNNGVNQSSLIDNKNNLSKTDDQHKNSKNAVKEESQELFVSKSKNAKQEKSLLQSEYNDTPSSAHFMGYFLTAIVLCIAGYVVFHNKQKIIAFIIEGRNQKRSRRPNSGEYRKLQTSVDDVMSSIEKSTTSHNYIY